MKRFGWLWPGLFILSVAFGCSPGKGQLKSEPREEPLIRTAMEAPKEKPTKPAEKERGAPEGKREVFITKETAEPLPQPSGTERSGRPPSPQPPASKSSEAPKGSKFVLNFDNADLYEVIRVIADMMKINYLIDPKVKGIVNIHTSGQITGEEIFPIFQSILKLNGATAVPKGAIYEIVPLGEAKKLYTVPSTLKDAAVIMPEERYTIQIIPLKFIPVSEVSKMIKPFLSDGADIVEHPPQNILIIGDVASNVRKSLDIIALFDVDIFAELRVRIYPIIHAEVNEIAKEMERIFASFEVSLKSARGVGITFTPISRINSLLVVSSIPQIFEKVERWLKEIDRVPAEGAKPSVFVYYVQNGKAKDLAEVLKQVYGPEKKKVELKEKVVTPPTPPGPRGVKPSPTPPTPPAPPTPSPPSPKEEEALPPGAVPEGEITIVVDENTNALIIRALPRDYKTILEIIKKLDLYPKQVLIEVFLAEVTLDDKTKYGLEFSTFKAGDYTVGMGGIAYADAFASGIRYSVVSAGKLTAAIHASATENRLKVISSPHILASNNKEAKIQIGRSEPILTSTYTTTGTSSPGVVEGTIEYKDIGIILTVTPRISDAKLVTLDISIEQSDVGKTKLGTLDFVPYFQKKTAKTTLSIMEGQTIVIGGFIEEKKDEGKAGVPFLSRIPILGALFGYHSDEVGKKETVLLLTPRVITDLDESNQVTREFREKVQTLKKELEKREKDKK